MPRGRQATWEETIKTGLPTVEGLAREHGEMGAAVAEAMRLMAGAVRRES